MAQLTPLQRLAGRLNGLQNRLKDLHTFKAYLGEDKPRYFTVAVAGGYNSEGQLVTGQYFSVDLNDVNIKLIDSLSDDGEKQLLNEIDIVKDEMRKLLDQ